MYIDKYVYTRVACFYMHEVLVTRPVARVTLCSTMRCIQPPISRSRKASESSGPGHPSALEFCSLRSVRLPINTEMNTHLLQCSETGHSSQMTRSAPPSRVDLTRLVLCLQNRHMRFLRPGAPRPKPIKSEGLLLISDKITATVTHILPCCFAFLRFLMMYETSITVG